MPVELTDTPRYEVNGTMNETTGIAVDISSLSQIESELFQVKEEQWASIGALTRCCAEPTSAAT